MKRWRILTIGHTALFIHPAVLPFAAYAFLLGHGTLWLISALSILLHETAHALVAAAFGCAPSAVEMTPLGAVMLLEDEMKLSSFKRAGMLLAGPLASAALVGLAVWMTGEGWIALSIGRHFFLCNIAIVLINLLPVFPLDGGRLLHLLLSSILPAHHAVKALQVLGGVVGIALIGLNLVISLKYGGWNLSLAFAGCSILYSTAAAVTTSKLRELRSFMDRKIALERRGVQPCKVLCAMGNLPLHRLLRILPVHQQAIFTVVEPGSMSLLGVIDENQLMQHYLNQPGMTLTEALFLSENAVITTNDDTI